jgi:hypothetical protein
MQDIEFGFHVAQFPAHLFRRTGRAGRIQNYFGIIGDRKAATPGRWEVEQVNSRPASLRACSRANHGVRRDQRIAALEQGARRDNGRFSGGPNPDQCRRERVGIVQIDNESMRRAIRQPQMYASREFYQAPPRSLGTILTEANDMIRGLPKKSGHGQ